VAENFFTEEDSSDSWTAALGSGTQNLFDAKEVFCSELSTVQALMDIPMNLIGPLVQQLCEPYEVTFNKSEIVVFVANGSGTSGGGGRISDSLISRGYEILPAGNALITEVSTIYFKNESMKLEALLLRSDLMEKIMMDGPYFMHLQRLPYSPLEGDIFSSVLPATSINRAEMADIVIVLGSDDVFSAD
jgi:hypothetical protein